MPNTTQHGGHGSSTGLQRLAESEAQCRVGARIASSHSCRLVGVSASSEGSSRCFIFQSPSTNDGRRTGWTREGADTTARCSVQGQVDARCCQEPRLQPRLSVRCGGIPDKPAVSHLLRGTQASPAAGPSVTPDVHQLQNFSPVGNHVTATETFMTPPLCFSSRTVWVDAEAASCCLFPRPDYKTESG